jgi:hypothetical protein
VIANQDITRTALNEQLICLTRNMHRLPWNASFILADVGIAAFVGGETQNALATKRPQTPALSDAFPSVQDIDAIASATARRHGRWRGTSATTRRKNQ